MTPLLIFETFASLAVQVTLLILLASWMARKRLIGADADWCWASLHVCILLLTAAAFFLPHLRLVTWADLEPSKGHPTADAACWIAGQICAWTWFTGSVVVIVVSISGMFRATSLVRRAGDEDGVREVLEQEISGLASLPAKIAIRVSPDEVSPFCWQFHRPVVVLPESVRKFPAGQQAAIVRHELAHLRLQHPLHLFLQRLVEAVYWFHPLVWWASRQAAAAREFRCDRESVSSSFDVAEYLRSLLRLIESQLKPPERLPAGMGFLGDASLLSKRASALAECCSSEPRPQANRRMVLCLFAVAAVCSIIWLPINPNASRRSDWSPWPTWSAHALNATGVTVRDYEIDGHRLSHHNH